MRDMNDFIKTFQEAAVKAVEAGKPTTVLFGTVTSVSPLTVYVDSKLIITEEFLKLARNVTDFDTEVTVDWLTENRGGGSGDAAFSSHNHNITGRKPIRVHNALKAGEKVIMLRQAGGQTYVIIDRVV